MFGDKCSITSLYYPVQYDDLKFQDSAYMGNIAASNAIWVVTYGTRRKKGNVPKSTALRHIAPIDYNETSNNEDEEELVFFDPRINKIESQKETIHVLYSIQKEFIYRGENKEDSTCFVAISEDDGENWFFVRRGMYLNEKICTEIPRLLK